MKTGKGVKALIIILVIAVIGLATYIVLDKTVLNKDTNKESKNATTDNTNLNDEANTSTVSTQKNNVTENTKPSETFKVEYTPREVKRITGKNANYVCTEQVPHITGVDEAIAFNIENELNNRYSEEWKDIDEQTKDGSLDELMENISYDIGFDQSYNVIFLTDNVVTFEHMLDGGLGGVSWGKTSGISFDLKTGKVINIADIVTDKEKYISTCKEIVFEQLRNDSRFEDVKNYNSEKNYEDVINEEIEKMEGYLTADGIVCVEIPKYEIATGGSGEFKFTVAYEFIKDYIDSKYVNF